MKNSDYEINGLSLENIRNTYEISVIRAMKDLLPEYPEFDNCQICIEDIYALALSRIPSTYVQVGTVIMKKDLGDNELVEVVKYAIQQVMKSPKHSEN